MRRLFAFILIPLLAIMLAGCVCNNSKITSVTSDAEIDRLLESTFEKPMQREDRIRSVFELVDPDHILLAVVESEDGNTLLAMLTKPGCAGWPLRSDSTLRLVFDDSGRLVAHERWMNTDPERSLTLDEDENQTSSVERKRRYTLTENATRSAYRRVYKSELME